MNEDQSPIDATKRRDFMKVVGGASAFAGMTVPHVHGAESDTIEIALVGCGGRGTGAANQALSVKTGKTKLVAMADVFSEKMRGSHDALNRKYGEDAEKFDVPEERKFMGFNAYKQAMDALRPGDIVILTTPVAFRHVHFKYAIERGLNVFMEKPLTADGPTSKKMIALAAEADKKNLKVGVGLMVRHCRGRMALKERIDNGEIGDIVTMRASRMQGPIATCFCKPKPEDMTEVMYQVKNFHSFLWASGGLYNDFYIHQIDETCWMKGKWPVEAYGIGGRHYRGDNVDQNFDSYGVQYKFDDGTELFFEGRTMIGTFNNMSSIVRGTKGSAIVSNAGHTPGKVKIFPDQLMKRRSETWAWPQPEENPYQLEWDDLVDAIVNDKPYNEVVRGVQASLVSSMGRMASHTGMKITYDQILNSDHEFAPDIANLSEDGPAPVVAAADGSYAVPEPGVKKDREY